MSRRKNAHIQENKYVKELLSILKEYQPQAGKELTEALGQVAEMEKRLAVAVDELKTMRQDLENMQNGPLKVTLQKSIANLQKCILALRDNIVKLKENIIEGCKNAISDFKVRGVSALNSISRTLHIKSGLEEMRNNLNIGIRINEKVIAKIEAVSSEYHDAGRHLKNIGRNLVGKETIKESKPIGRLAKAIQAPYRVDLACLLAMRKNVEKSIDGLTRLEQASRKPVSILKTMQQHKEKIQPPQNLRTTAPIHDRR